MSFSKAPISGSVSNFFSFGWARMKENFLVFFLLVFLLVLLDIPVELVEDFDGDQRDSLITLLQILAFAYFLLLLPIFEYGADLLFVQGWSPTTSTWPSTIRTASPWRCPMRSGKIDCSGRPTTTP